MSNSAFIQSVGGGGSSIDLEINGVANADQALLNLIGGSGISISDNGSGGAVFAFSGSVTTPSLSAVLGVNPANTGIAITGDNFLSADSVSSTIFTDTSTGTFPIQTDANGNVFLQGHDTSPTKTYNIGFDSAGDIQMTDTVSKDVWFSVSGGGTGSVVSLGDTLSQGNKNQFVIDDANEIMQGNISSEFVLQSPTGSQYLLISPGTNEYAGGDTQVVNNGTAWYADDQNKIFYIQSNGSIQLVDSNNNIYIGVDLVGHLISLGDVSGSGLITGINMNVPVQLRQNLNMTNTFITNLRTPVNPPDGANKGYVDAVARGLIWHTPVQVATTTTLPTNTYNNGVAGVGATLTAVAPGVLTLDGYSPALNDRVLVKNEATPANDGVYTLTTVGTSGVAYILTRATDMNTTGGFTTASVEILNGSTQQFSAWVQTQTVTTVGTTAVAFVEFSNNAYGAGAGLSLSGNIFALDTAHSNEWTGRQSFDSTMFQLLGSSSGALNINAAAATSSYSIFMPAGQGEAGETLVNDGSGNLNWETIISLETNGNPNGTQNLLNLVAGTGITLTDDGSGDVTIDVTGGGGGSTDVESYSLVASMRFLSGN